MLSRLSKYNHVVAGQTKNFEMLKIPTGSFHREQKVESRSNLEKEKSHKIQ